jgi:hypothetical protein
LAAAPTQPEATRPPENNDQTLRKLSPDEIPPNLSFYAVDPLYKPGVPLGWSATRIDEKLDRGLVVSALEGGSAYLTWRLILSDPPDAAFNVYRSSGGAAAVKLSTQPLRQTSYHLGVAARAGAMSTSAPRGGHRRRSVRP